MNLLSRVKLGTRLILIFESPISLIHYGLFYIPRSIQVWIRPSSIKIGVEKKYHCWNIELPFLVIEFLGFALKSKEDEKQEEKVHEVIKEHCDKLTIASAENFKKYLDSFLTEIGYIEKESSSLSTIGIPSFEDPSIVVAMTMTIIPKDVDDASSMAYRVMQALKEYDDYKKGKAK